MLPTDPNVLCPGKEPLITLQSGSWEFQFCSTAIPGNPAKHQAPGCQCQGKHWAYTLAWSRGCRPAASWRERGSPPPTKGLQDWTWQINSCGSLWRAMESVAHTRSRGPVAQHLLCRKQLGSSSLVPKPSSAASAAAGAGSSVRAALARTTQESSL